MKSMLDQVQQTAQQVPSLKAGYALIATGGTGSFVQAITEWASLAVTAGNAFLVLGGLYLMYCKIKNNRRRDHKEGDE